MEYYRYKQTAIFADETSARAAKQHIQDGQFANIKLFVLTPTDKIDPIQEEKLEPEGDEIARSIVRDAVYGGAGGAAMGAIASLAAGAVEFSIFATFPIAATVAAISYGAVLGATSGSLIGENLKEEDFVSHLEQALTAGHWVVIAHSTDKASSKRISALLDKENAEQHLHVR